MTPAYESAPEMIPAAAALLIVFWRWRNPFTTVGAIIATVLLFPIAYELLTS